MRKWMFAFTLLAACASKPAEVHAPEGVPKSELLYPHGTYQHKVQVRIVQPPRDFELKGVIRSQPGSLKVVGLSSFNTTVFRIDENLKTGEINKEFYVDTIRRNEEKFMFFYQLLKELVLAPMGQVEFDRQGAHFKVSDPDERGIRRRIEIRHPQVNLDIRVTGYEL